MQTLQHDVIALYTADYARQWDALLGDLDVAPMRNLQQAVQGCTSWLRHSRRCATCWPASRGSSP